MTRVTSIFEVSGPIKIIAFLLFKKTHPSACLILIFYDVYIRNFNYLYFLCIHNADEYIRVINTLSILLRTTNFCWVFRDQSQFFNKSKASKLSICYEESEKQDIKVYTKKTKLTLKWKYQTPFCCIITLIFISTTKHQKEEVFLSSIMSFEFFQSSNFRSLGKVSCMRESFQTEKFNSILISW